MLAYHIGQRDLVVGSVCSRAELKKKKCWPGLSCRPSLKWVPKMSWESEGDRYKIDHITNRMPIGLSNMGANLKYLTRLMA